MQKASASLLVTLLAVSSCAREPLTSPAGQNGHADGGGDGDVAGDGDLGGDGDVAGDGDVSGDGDLAGDGDASGEGDTDAGAGGGGKLPPVTSVDEMGPFPVTIDEGAGPNDGWIARPTDLGRDGLLHPIFTWGCGGGSQPSQYRDHLTRWASHGFVVEAHESTGEGDDHLAAIDWFIAEYAKSGSDFYQKLDITKIASGGHSMGSVSTFAMADDPRLTTTIHVAGGSFDGKGPDALSKPVAYICGADDTTATPNCERDFAGTKVPVFFTVMDGVNNVYAAREGMGAIVGWLRWHLGGETDRKSMFVGNSCDFCSGKFVSMSKNW